MRDKARSAVLEQFKALEFLQVEYVPIDSVFPNNYNPNRQSPEEHALLLQSMRDNGFTQPIMVRRENRAIVDGYHRWLAAKELEFTTIPIVIVDFSDVQAQASTLRMNRARGSDDIELLAQMLRDLDKLGALQDAQQTLGLDPDIIQRLIGDMKISDAMADPNGSFSDAWVPQAANSGERSGEVNDKRMVGTSTAAIEATVQYEAAAAVAPTEDARKVLQAQFRAQSYRLNFVFVSDDAAIVKAVLGMHASPSTRVLEMCNKQLATLETA